ncbi:efflux RND transporter permease subunit, partial [Photobacterium sanctipauli]
MQLPSVCIRHPVFASVLSIAIVLLGLLSFQKLSVRYFPAHQDSTATVSANITGASAEFMSRNVADKLIDAASGIDSIETMETDCGEGSCSLAIEFSDDVDETEYTNLMNKLRSSVEGITDFPPSMTDKPTVTDNTFALGAASNVITFVNTGEMDQQAMFDYIDQQLIPQFRHIQGVGSVNGPFGGEAKAVRVWLKPERMKALNIQAADVVGTLSTYNSTFTAGTIKGEARDFSINPVTQVDNIDDVRNLVIRVDEGQIIRVKDIADINMGAESLTPNMLSIDGHQALSLEIAPFKAENPIVVTERIQAAMEKMQAKLPAGIEMKMVYNEADFIDSAINQGFSTLIEAIVLVSLVVMLFLGSIRVASIPVITIPVCVIGVFAVMSWLGFSINMMTILAIILAIGLVVDDAIVVVENCYRHIENG